MSDADCHIVAYGIESMLNSSLKILIILCVGALIGYFREVVIAMFVFGGIRKFAGGYHSSSHLGCLSVMLFICLCPIPLFGVEVRVAGWVWLAIAVYALYEVIRYAPRNSRVNPIYDQGILRRKRVGSLIVTGLAVVFLALYPGNELRWLVAMPLFIEALTISPLFYGKKDKTDGEAS
ncbi:MAG: accessory gene regulator B family protein [Lachnospiraceae bacterium]|nr:accessory gene regulator B family protein [Lachnospiraceae bacterium]